MDRFGHSYIYIYVLMGFPGSSLVKNPPAMQGAQVQSLDGEVPLEEGMATHSNTLAWKISWREEPGGLQSTGLKKVRHVILSTHTGSHDNNNTDGILIRQKSMMLLREQLRFQKHYICLGCSGKCHIILDS